MTSLRKEKLARAIAKEVTMNIVVDMIDRLRLHSGILAEIGYPNGSDRVINNLTDLEGMVIDWSKSRDINIEDEYNIS